MKKTLFLLSVILMASTSLALSPVAGVGPSYIRPVVSTALEASHVIRTSSSSLYSLAVTDTTAEYIMIIDSGTLPADGPVTLMYPPIKVAANTTTIITFTPALRAANGITICNSSTGTLSKTIGGSTCIFSAQAL